MSGKEHEKFFVRHDESVLGKQSFFMVKDRHYRVARKLNDGCDQVYRETLRKVQDFKKENPEALEGLAASSEEIAWKIAQNDCLGVRKLHAFHVRKRNAEYLEYVNDLEDRIRLANDGFHFNPYI